MALENDFTFVLKLNSTLLPLARLFSNYLKRFSYQKLCKIKKLYKTCPLANSKTKKESHHCKMEIKFKRSGEIVKTITVSENQINAKRSV